MKTEGKKKLKTVITVAAVLILASLIAGIKLYTDSLNKKEKQYTVITLREKDPVVLKGNSEPMNMQTIMTDPSKGIAGEPNIQSGSKVVKGDVLFSYRSQAMEDQVTDMQSAYNRASDAYDSAETDLYNAREKRDENESSLETARANLDEAQSSGDPAGIEKYSGEVSKYESKSEQYDNEVSQFEKNLKNLENEKDDALTRLERAKSNADSNEKAEIDGILIVHEENRKTAAAPYMEIVSEKTVLTSLITEYDYEKAKEGNEVEIRVIPDNETLKGKISYVSILPEKSAQGLPQTSGVNYQVRVTPEKDIKYGYSVEISLPSDEIVIPAKSIITDDKTKKEYVYQVINGKAYKKEITTEADGDIRLLKSGLKKGDIIVSDPDSELKDGMEVKVTK